MELTNENKKEIKKIAEEVLEEYKMDIKKLVPEDIKMDIKKLRDNDRDIKGEIKELRHEFNDFKKETNANFIDIRKELYNGLSSLKSELLIMKDDNGGIKR